MTCDIYGYPAWPVTERTPYLWTVQKPNGTKYHRHYHSVERAWAALCGANYGGMFKQENTAKRQKRIDQGYSVVPIAWKIAT